MIMRRIWEWNIAPYWYRVAGFLTVMFFILLSDAILSDFVPGYIQGITGSAAKMGWIMAVSSMVGIVMDLLFPQLLRRAGVKQLAGMAIVGALVFILSLWGSTRVLPIMLVLIGMAAWGVYYELDSFMTKQFVAKVAPTHARGMVWGVVGTFRNLAYLVGPIIGAMIVGLGDSKVIVSAGMILLLAYSLFALIKLPENEQLEEDIHGVSIVTEMKHWWTLARVTWPVLAMSLLIGLVDAVFWTTGTVVNDVLAKTNRYGGLFLSAYMLPSLFVRLAVAKWGIYKGKKHWSAIMLLIGGVVLAGITISQRIEWILGVVLISSIFMGLAWPLIDATYTDFTVRMGRGRKHMIGISSSVLSLAYVVGPIVGGMMAEKVGELESFGWLGVMVASIALLLLITMPRKIRLPENEIGNWDKNL